MHIQPPTILILDSGMGGLSIYMEIKKLLPFGHYLYFFDNQAFPYGERSKIFITKRVISIIKTIKHIHHHIHLIVIACNTASVTSLKILKNYFSCPIIGVIPAIKLASKYTKNGIIGVLATLRTINHYFSLYLIQKFTTKHTILLLNASQLVNIAESKVYEETIQNAILDQVLAPWLKIKKFPDTIVLGCTHFSLLQKELTEILPKNCYLIDPTRFIAKHSMYILSKFKNISTYKNYKYIKNRAYCSSNTKKIIKIKSILLLHYNFDSLEVLSII